MNVWHVCPSSWASDCHAQGLLEREPYPGWLSLSVAPSPSAHEAVGQALRELFRDAGVQR